MLEEKANESAAPNIEISRKVAVIAWAVAATCYFYQYVLRSAPSVMMPELSAAFGVSATAVASIVGFFYY